MLRITGGKVYDPANGIDGVVKDICIADGRLVAESRRRPDDRRHRDDRLSGRGRRAYPRRRRRAQLRHAGLTPENMRRRRPFIHTPEHRAGLGGMTPTTFATGYLYAGMGWTTVNEAAVPVLSARHTHEELDDTPIVDKAWLVLRWRTTRSCWT